MSTREQKYKDAVWDYLLEHSDITKGGSLFVKFHTKSRSVFEGHVNSRIGGYHRGDPVVREKILVEKTVQHVLTKKSKKEKWKATKEERFAAIQLVAIENKIRNYPPVIKQLARIYEKKMHKVSKTKRSYEIYCEKESE